MSAPDDSEVTTERDERHGRRRRGGRHERHPGNRAGGAIAGAVLMIIGVLLALKKLELMTADPFHQLWPLALIAVGAGKLLGRAGHALSGWGLWLVLAGLWFFALNFEMFGASRGLTGPIIVVITGFVLVVKSFDGGSAVGAR